MEKWFIFLVLALFPLTILGHGNMMLPTPWMDPGGKIGLRNKMNCVGAFSSCLWFTNYTFIPGKPTLDPSLWTYPKIALNNEPVFQSVVLLTYLVQRRFKQSLFSWMGVAYSFSVYLMTRTWFNIKEYMTEQHIHLLVGYILVTGIISFG